MIRVQNLYHDYEGKGQYAVEDISFDIGKGEIFGFLGPSGAGKSTVQNLMTGLLPLQRGQICYEDKPLPSLRATFFNRVGVSFEHPNLYLKLTGYENLKYYAGLFDVPTEAPMKLLEMVGLADAAHKKASSYSKGMKQRLVFARALINRPQILFLDEPTSGLDPSIAEGIKNIIQQKQQEGTTIFLTTHNMFIADQLCGQVAFLNNGRIVALDTPRNLKLQFGNRAVKVEYSNGAGTESAVYFLDNEPDRAAFTHTVNSKQVQTMHTQEATLEQIFIKLTGRGLS
jgi:fluoroquinolone transport system ATP-binding protein